MARLEFRVRPIVAGDASGEAVVVDAISFYGDVNPKTGVLVDGRPIRGRILLAERSRGSTVGSYIIYALKRYGTAPAAIVIGRSEPIVIAGAVLAGIPLYDSAPPELFRVARDGARVTVRSDGRLIVEF